MAIDMKNLTKKGLEKLIDDVSQGLNAVLEKAEAEGLEGQPLVKADPGQEAPAEKVPSGSSSEGSEPSAPAEESSAPPASDSGSESAPPSDAAPAPEGAPAPDASGAPAEETGGTVEQLQAEYAALPVEEQKMHLLALKAALMSTLASQGGEGDAGMADAGSPAPEGAPAPDASAAPAAPMPAPAPEQTEAPPMAKSEPDVALVLELATLKKSLAEKEEALAGMGQLTAAFKNFLEKNNGRRLSVASASVLTKTGTELAKTESEIDVSSLTSDQITKKLTEVVASKSLTKTDKDLVLKYVAGRDKKDVGTIAHLLK
jgi:hypothetical protein